MSNLRFYQKQLKAAVKKLLRLPIQIIINNLNNGKFAARIKKRHRRFWKPANAEKIRNTIMCASDPLEKWKDVNDWQRKLSNKHNAREFARKHGCKVAALYWKGRDYNNINFDNLPENYVIRPTRGHSLNNIFLMNGSFNLMDGKNYAKSEIKEMLVNALERNSDLEFLIEEFVRTEQGEYAIPLDYKFHMFNGHTACIQVISRHKGAIKTTTWYDENWQQIENFTANYPEQKDQLPPKCFSEMKEAARQLSLSYKIFCRIDFYATDKGAVFGEFTPTPGLGKGYSPGGNKLLTCYWDKYCKRMI